MGEGLLSLLRRLALLPRRARLDRELEEELRFHLEMGSRAAREEGASEEEARRAPSGECSSASPSPTPARSPPRSSP